MMVVIIVWIFLGCNDDKYDCAEFLDDGPWCPAVPDVETTHCKNDEFQCYDGNIA